MKNLLQKGKSKDSIHFVGNVMIDNLFYQTKKLENDNGNRFPTFKLKQKNKDYVFSDSSPAFECGFQRKF